MIVLLGVGHVFNLGPRVRQEILQRTPDLVCLELDPQRLEALTSGAPRSGSLGLYGFLATFQERIAAEYGAGVGEEMLAAREAAEELGVPLALIDVDVRRTWRRLWSAMGPWELVRLLVSTLGAFFVGRDRVEAELDRYRSDSDAFLAALGEDFPSVKRVLVDERNAHMADRLRALETEYETVLAVVGDGHVEGLAERLADRPLEALRLWDLRAPAPERRTGEDPPL